jgi:hypothetical protein
MTRLGGPTRWRRRVVVLAVLSLLLGFVTTWAVAWGLVVWTRSHFDKQARYSSSTQSVDANGVELEESRFANSGLVRCCYGVRFPAKQAQPGRLDVRFEDAPPAWTEMREAWEEWRMLPPAVDAKSRAIPGMKGLSRDGQTASYQWFELSCGWPYRCFHAWGSFNWWEGAVRCPRWLARPTPYVVQLPILPWWPGLIGNTLIFTAPWFLLALTLDFMYRDSLRRRGHCPSCAYNLRGDIDAGCPECGWGREREAKTVDAGDAP